MSEEYNKHVGISDLKQKLEAKTNEFGINQIIFQCKRTSNIPAKILNYGNTTSL